MELRLGHVVGILVVTASLLVSNLAFAGKHDAPSSQPSGEIPRITNSPADDPRELRRELADLRAELDRERATSQALRDRATKLEQDVQDQLREVRALRARLAALMRSLLDDDAEVRKPPSLGAVKSVTARRETREAVCTLGSADGVRKDQRLMIADEKTFFGYLVVDRVEANECSGDLVGPHIDAIHEGHQVSTQ